MPARDALHYQMLLRDDLSPGGAMGPLLDGFERSQRGLDTRSGEEPAIEALPSPYGLFSPRRAYDETGDGLRQYFAGHLDLALAYYVDPKMTALVTAAAESLPVDTVLRPHDLPSTHGFLLIPEGLAEVDLRGQMMVHNAVAWFKRGNAIDLWFLSNKNDTRDMVNLKHRTMFGEETFRIFPTLMPAVYTEFKFGDTIPFSTGGSKVLPPEITEGLHMVRDPKTGNISWFWPEGYSGEELEEWMAGNLEIGPNRAVAWVFALWKIMGQTITDVRTEPVDRTLRRAAEKRQMKQNTVSVIALRKRKRVEGEGPEQEIEWSHRWLRRGHWRKQWYGPRDGEIGLDRFQEPIWIHPTICGPEDKPLLVRDHVYSLER